jgi:membrane associated rhomboid family serine protease
MDDKNKLTNFKREPSDHAKIFDAVAASLLFLIVCWGLFLIDTFLGYHIKNYGLKPRHIEGLWGLFTMHFLHADWKHITQNSLGFIVLNSFLFYFYRTIALKVFFAIFFLAPLIVWVVARDSNHIGASLLIYGIFSFLLVSGIIRNNPPLMRVALVVITFYGSLIWYIFPIEERVSFEGHMSGFIIGLLCAVVWRKQGPIRAPYRFEVEPELPDDENAYWKTPEQRAKDLAEKPEETTVSIKYHYKEIDNSETKPN